MATLMKHAQAYRHKAYRLRSNRHIGYGQTEEGEAPEEEKTRKKRKPDDKRKKNKRTGQRHTGMQTYRHTAYSRPGRPRLPTPAHAVQ